MDVKDKHFLIDRNANELLKNMIHFSRKIKNNISEDIDKIISKHECKCKNLNLLSIEPYNNYLDPTDFVHCHTKCGRKYLNLQKLCAMTICKYQLCVCDVPEIILFSSQNNFCKCIKEKIYMKFARFQPSGTCNISFGHDIFVNQMKHCSNESEQLFKDYIISSKLFKINHNKKCDDFLNWKFNKNHPDNK